MCMHPAATAVAGGKPLSCIILHIDPQPFRTAHLSQRGVAAQVGQGAQVEEVEGLLVVNDRL